MVMDRRSFVKRSSFILAGASLGFFTGCEKDSEEQIKKVVENSLPNVERNFSMQREFSDGIGNISFLENNKIHFLRVEDKNHNSIEGLEGVLLSEDVSGNEIIFVSDPAGNYFPEIHVPGTNGEFLKMTPKKDLKNLGLKDYLVKKAEEDFPSFSSENVIKSDAFSYNGDWSFNQAKNLISDFKDLSTIVSFAFPVAAPVAGVLQTADSVLDFADQTIDVFNKAGITDINKDKEFSVYRSRISGTTGLYLFLEKGSVNSDIKEESMRKLMPLQKGNSWEYNTGEKLKVSGVRSFYGEEVLAIKNSLGGEEYFKFRGEDFVQVGVNAPDVGDVVFNPGIVLGGKKVSVGELTSGSSEVLYKGLSGTSGNVDWNISCVNHGTYNVSGGIFANCFELEERDSLRISGPNGIVDQELVANHVYCRNIGKIIQSSGGNSVELVDYDVSGLGFGGKKSLELRNNYFSPLSRKVIEGVRRR